MFRYGKGHLSFKIAIDIAKGREQTTLDDDVIDNIRESRERVEQLVASGKTTYGVNTGFGPLCDTLISLEKTSLLQRNLLLTHAVGVGEYVAPLVSKLMLVCKLHALCQGYSGISLEVINRLVYFLEHDIIPAVPEQGSVGASGDLAPLSHLFLPLIGEGSFWIGEEIHGATTILKEHALSPIELKAKEGLALINGTQFILAHAVIGLDKMAYLLDLADVAGAMSLEGFQGSNAPFREELHAIRPFKGNLAVAVRMRMLLDSSENIVSHQDCGRVQDPYSIRCIPQVHGASRNAWYHLRELVEIELNSVTDNPIILSSEEAISGGNFHGQPLAMALDYASLAASELGNISDRRSYLLLEGKYGLPRLLTKYEGLNSGMMIPQYTTAALASENKSLCFPSSADSIPTSLGQEDHVSMGSISGRKFNQILSNLEKILAIELMLATQAMDFRRPLRFSQILESNYNTIRSQVDHLEKDRLLKDDIQAMITLVERRAITVE